MYKAKFAIWEVDYDEDVDDPGAAERDERVVEGFYDEPTKMDVVNAFVYELRGRKSAYELAWVDEITELEK